jgi:hypothetical protein
MDRTLIPLFALVTLVAVNAVAASTLDEVIQKRAAALTEILEGAKAALKQGNATPDDVRIESLRLFAFRRDTAKAQTERVQWQERIVAVEQEFEGIFQKRVATGTATPLDQLRAKERALAAEQLLLELQAAK